ncbi:beta-ketoacyl-ACP synthase III [Desertifilum sp. FACHB-1129]|uniref:3-oxoacyl-ACP synthase n=1 Tax=Desertifilum tharense IPPAS B-1220 TaxID=1781255 RepID=A0A1E5QKM9_9CYAN|nr:MULTISPECIES: beta-ketoacyl-ACP synthase III [Desertifilum]MDA0209776.1 beta-ketoacyl-ACP synthase III [Cyanobacteria bacterium FC1]MBD2310733.1 beta-ketoacyl-ACP synthase III [Desertifilum sp. FACHB-1129]MBD2320770.1 beta-ketoacyl-ACP synthase III [Desertifilum sp. FACHB-866]MBD2330898.1 beta-ketoacyl-ACP synthase III [Desertifilum sp. FACHB-868]OEJ75151.1 3-oxoacyl-ACP synthase [Desertifilum tharense IPPAS B-1220]
MRRVKILSTGKYLPKKQVTAQELESRLGLPPGWVEKKSGVLVRHFVDGETASEMGAFAAKDALVTAGLSINEIDCIICTSGIPEQAIPCTAALIQKHLGAGDSGIPAFDINSTCLSFLTGLDMVSYLIAAGRYSRVLLVASEIAMGLDWNDKESCTLFGDGAAAAIVAKTEETDTSRILASNLETYSKGAHLTECQGGGNKHHPQEYASHPETFLFRMDGRGVYRLASERLPGFFAGLLQASGLRMADLQLVIPHQASLMAMRLLRKQLDIPEEKLMVIAHNHGNTIAASVPMALHEAIAQGKLQRGDRCMLLGTSAGFSVGGIVLEY